jgi:hypothetical protein
MRLPEDCMRYEVRSASGAWEQVRLEQLEPGDLIRIFLQDGTPVMDANESEHFIVAAPLHIEISAAHRAFISVH